jgi:hypothetical protein
MSLETQTANKQSAYNLSVISVNAGNLVVILLTYLKDLVTFNRHKSLKSN